MTNAVHCVAPGKAENPLGAQLIGTEDPGVDVIVPEGESRQAAPLEEYFPAGHLSIEKSLV